MSIRVKIPTQLRSLTAGEGEVVVEAASVRELIGALETNYPGIGERLMDDAGDLRRFINVFVGQEDIRFLKGLDTPVTANEEVSIIPAIAGGEHAIASRS